MGCCQLVGDLTVDGCYISINTSCNVEGAGETAICSSYSGQESGEMLQTVTVTGYASTNIHIGCPGRAGVSTTLTRKYDYDRQATVFMCDGQGASHVVGDVNGLASVLESQRSCEVFSASASSGPASIYIQAIQTTGLGLAYIGGPISFTTSEDCTTMSISIGPISGNFYLQSFSLDAQPGQLPIASYTFTRAYKD